VKKGKIKIYPKNFEAIYFQWLENLRDWNISRQIAWGIRIPAWRCSRCHPERSKRSRDSSATPQNDNKEQWIVTEGDKPKKCPKCGSTKLEQDPDTFDTWFSSSQWPYVTLMTTKRGDFEKFYPTTVMETGYDILRWWVARMVMIGLYATGKIPFEHIVLHGLVNDPLGKKMSKSKGNVVNPLELIDKYGADAVRFALVYGNATGNDQSLSYTKLDAARKFTNKLWNMARFIAMKRSQISNLKSQKFDSNLTIKQLSNITRLKNDKQMIEKTQKLVEEITEYLNKYQFNLAAERLYDFAWHEFADKYIEDVKSRINENSFLVLSSLFLVQLKLLHPFMPFVTEEIYQRFNPPAGGGESIMIDEWPAFA